MESEGLRPMKKNKITTRAFTIVELLVVIAIIAILIGILLPVLSSVRQSARTSTDSTQATQILKAMISMAQEDPQQRLPTPGRINRLANMSTGVAVQMQGMGEEDPAQNTTANLYSACLAKEAFGVESLIGPTEYVGSNVVQMGKASSGGAGASDPDPPYDLNRYNPSADVYWDTRFYCNLNGNVPPSGQPAVCHSSYAHQPLFGQRKALSWRAVGESTRPLLGTRGPIHTNLGPESAVIDADIFDASPTLLLHGSKKEWAGNMVFGDGHVEFLNTMFPTQVQFNCGGLEAAIKDNIFAMDFLCNGAIGVTGAAKQADAIIAFTIQPPTAYPLSGGANDGVVVYDLPAP